MSLQKAREEICNFICDNADGVARIRNMWPHERKQILMKLFTRYETELLKANGLERSEEE